MKNLKLKFNKKFSSGITLMETLITIAIIGIIASLAWMIFMQGMRVWRLNIAQLEVQRDGRIVMDIMQRNLKQAESGTIVMSRNSSLDPPYSKITFTHINGGTYSYYQNGQECYKSIDGNSSRIAKNLKNLMFATVESGDDSIISIGLCMEKASYQGRSRVSKLSFQKVRIMN